MSAEAEYQRLRAAGEYTPAPIFLQAKKNGKSIHLKLTTIADALNDSLNERLAERLAENETRMRIMERELAELRGAVGVLRGTP